MTEMLIVSTKNAVTCLKMGDLQYFSQNKSEHNPKGLYGVSVPEAGEAGAFCIAMPFEALGKVRVQWFTKDFKEILELQHTFQAHNTAVKQLVVNRLGTLIATASDKVCRKF